MDIDVKRIDNSDAVSEVKEVYRLLKRLMDQPERKKWLRKRRDNWDAVYESEGDSTIWTDKQRKDMEDKGMIPLTINDLYKGVQGSSAVVTDQKPGLQFLPIGSGDLYVAELMKRAHDQVWAQNYGNSEVYETVKETKIGGMGALNSFHDPAKGIYGKLVFGNTDPEMIYYDFDKAKKPDLSDVDIIKAHLVTKTYAKETYEGVTDEDLQFSAAPKPDDGATTDTASGVDNYTRDQKDDTPAGPTEYPEEQEDVWEIEAHLLKREKEYWLMIPDQRGGYARQVFGKDRKSEADEALKVSPEGSVVWPRVVEKRALRIVVGKKLIKQTQDGKEVDELINPYGIDADGDPIIPIVAFVHDKTRKGKPVGPTEFAKEACRERNKRRAQAIYVVSKNIDAPYYASGDTVKWMKDPVHGDWLKVDRTAPFPPARLAPGSVAQEALNMEAIAKADVDEMYDMQDVMKGKFPKGDPAKGTVMALMDMAGMMSKPFVRNLEAALERLGKINMAIILRTWPRSMWERLIEPEEMQSWEPDKQRTAPNMAEMMNGPDPNQEMGKKQAIASKWQNALELIRPMDPSKEPGITLIDIDVRVAAGSTLPTNRMARMAEARENVKMGIYDARAALDYIDDPHKDEIAARMEQREAMAAQMNAMKGGK